MKVVNNLLANLNLRHPRYLMAFPQALGLVLALACPSAALATANYVYHERSGNDVTGGAANTCGGPQAYVPVLSPTSIQAHLLRFKVEYQFYTDRLRVYYTTDGSSPSGAFGTPSGTTQVINGNYQCTFTASQEVDVCNATIPAQPAGTTVKYIISAWHNSGGSEIFANSGEFVSPFTTSSQATPFQYTVAGPPAIVCPTNVVVACASSVPAAATDATGFAAQGGTIASDCGGPYTVTSTDAVSSSNCPNQFTITRTYTVTDACTNSSNCDQTITVADTTGPVLANCPPTTLSLGCNPPTVPTTNTYNVTATDVCSTNTIFRSQVTVTNGCERTRTLTYTAVDACNNSNSCSQVITWTVDTTGPALANCPAPTLNIGCNPTSIPTCADYNVTATDTCGTNTLTCSQVDSTNGCVGTRTLRYTAVDACNNTNSCSQVITWTEDTTAPAVTCPADVAVACGQTGTNFTGVATATDNCVGGLAISFSDIAVDGDCPTNRVITRTWRAVDGCNNTGTCAQLIYVMQNGGPVFTNCPANVNLGCNPVSIPDCTTPVAATADCAVTVTCASVEATNGCVRMRTNIWTAVDDCDNTNTCTQVVTWTEDTTPPAFNPQPFAVCGATNNFGCNPNELGLPHCLASVGSTDACGSAVVCTQVQTTNLCAGSTTDGLRTRVVTYVATDVCGNSNVCKQTITWTVDKTKPVLAGCPATTLNLGCNPGSIPTTNTYNVTATDCSAVTFSYGQVDVTNGCTRTRTITYTATDCGTNSSTCSQVVTWTQDPTPPVFTLCPTNMDLNSDPFGFHYNDFATGLGTWTTTALNHAPGFNLDWSNTGNASGVAGEVGGLISRSNGVSLAGMPRILDTQSFVGRTLNLNSNLTVSGKMYLDDVSAFGDISFGYFSSADPSNRRLVLRVQAPASAGSGLWRFRFGIGSTLGTRVTVPDSSWDSASLDFTFTWTPSGLNDGSGTISGSVSKGATVLTIPSTGIGATAYTLDEFGLWVDPATATDLTKTQNEFFDNIRYTVVPVSIPGCDTSPSNVAATDDCGNTPIITCASTEGVTACVHTRTNTYTATGGCGITNTCVQLITWVADTNAPVLAGCPAPTLDIGCNPTSIPSCADYTVTATDDCSGTPTVSCAQVDTAAGCVNTRTLKYTASDANGNTATCTQVITWRIDTTPPGFANCPAPTLNLGCNPVSVPTCSSYNVVSSDGCSGSTLTCALTDVTNGCVRTRTVTYTAVDGCNNTNTCSQVITWTVDTAGPVLAGCPAPTLNLGCNPAPGSIPVCTNYNVTVTDDCSTPIVSCAQVDTTNGCLRTRTLTYTATDGCSHSTNCSQVITWSVDTTGPVLANCPAPTLSLGCNPPTVPTTNTYNVTATDVCSTNTIFRSQDTVTNGCERTRTLTYTAVDVCNNSNSCSQVITWTVDTTGPALANCPAPTLNIGCNPTSIPTCADYNVTATDTCGTNTLTCSQVDSTNGCVGTRTLRYTAVDACNNTNSCSQVITWTEDTTAPAVTCPADVAVACGQTGTNFTGVATATDNCVGGLAISFSDIAVDGDCPTNRVITRTWSAVDSCNNTGTCAQLIYVMQDGGPVFTNCPANVNLGCNPVSIPDCTTPVAATADCAVTVTCASVEATNGCVRMRTNIWTAVDECDHTNTCTQVVTWTEDTTPPAFNPQPFAVCGATNNFGCNPNELGLPHCLASIGATDACGSAGVVCTSVQTTNLCAGSTTDGLRTRVVTYTATDACGNTNVCKQTITWTVDKTKPVLAGCPATTLNLGCNPGSIPTTNTYNVTASDVCTAVALTSNQVDVTNGCLRTRTITYTATDCGTNTSTCSQVVTWREDGIAPVLAGCPATTLDLGCNPASVPTCTNYNVTATDACGASTLTCAQEDATNGCGRTRTLTYTAVDLCNNTNTCSQVITWTVDTAGPVLAGCPAPTLNLGCNPTPESIPVCTNYNVTATDDCGVTNLSCTQVDVTNNCLRTRTLTYTAVDACNHSTNCSQVITWTEDTTGPVLANCPATTLSLGCNPPTVPTTNTYNVTATDSCGTNTIFRSQVTVTNGCERTRTLTYTAVDACNNSNSCSQVITWTVDTTGPALANCPAPTLNIGCNPTSIPTCADYNVTATDTCGTNTLTCSQVDSTNGCVGTRTLRYTAVDACNNTNSCSQVITWTEDTTAPAVTCPADVAVACGQTGTNFTGVATATDNCVGGLAISFSDIAVDGDCPTNRVITRTWSAVDSCNNTGTCAQLIYVMQDGGPVFTNCPANVNLGCNPVSIPDCTTPVAATADCAVTVTCASVEATNGCVRMRTNIWTAVDECDHTNTCTQVVTWTEDTTPPTFNPQPFAVCGATNNFGCNPNELGLPHCLASVAATDACGAAPVVCTQVQTTNLCAGSTTDGLRTRVVTYVATDICGNSNVCKQTITWTVDKTKPVLAGCPATTLNLGCNPGSIPTTNTYNVTASDVCTAVTLTSGQVDVTNGCLRTRTITYTATDCGTNTSTCSQVVTWREDGIGPVLANCPAPTLDLGTNPVSVPTCTNYNVTATDACGSSTLTCAQADATNGCLRTRTLTYTAVDLCNNTNTCSQVITWTTEQAATALSIAIDGSNVVISWPVTCVNYVLEEAASLSVPITWTPNGQTPVVASGTNTVTVPITSNTFYRLRYP